MQRFTGTFVTLLATLIVISYSQTSSIPSYRYLPSLLGGLSSSIQRHRYYSVTATVGISKTKCLLVTILLICGDIESNPGPTSQAQIYPCGLCDIPVTWNQDAVCCDGCDIWHHKSCLELCSADYDLLAKHSHIQWLCCKCDSVNITSFTFHSFELSSYNPFHPLSELESTFDSFTSASVFSPLHISSPVDRAHTLNTHKSAPRPSSSISTDTTSLFMASEKRNLRIMNINCRSVVGKRAELQAAMNYIKPDIVCGSESWLKGVKPGKPPSQDAIQSSEVFPPNYKTFRHDRGTLGGGVFVLVHEDIVAEEKPEFVTACEVEWVQVKLKGKKDLLVSSFYMPQRKMKDVNELRRSLEIVSASKERHIIVAGDFNCPNIDWQNLSVRANAQDKEVQQAVLDLAVDFNLTQVHDKPTREGNLLDLTFSSNPSLIKSSSNAPGISDHDIVVTDLITRPHYARKKPRRCYLFSKANWDTLKSKVQSISEDIVTLSNSNAPVQKLWDTFKSKLTTAIQENIPSKMKTHKNTTPWINKKVRSQLRKKARLYKKAKHTNNWTEYRKFQRECKRSLRRAEWEHVNRLIDEGLKSNNTKPFWSFVKSRKEDNVGIAPLRNHGHLVTDPKGRAEILVDQFQSVFTKDSSTQPTPKLSGHVTHDIPPLTIGVEGVRKLLSNIKVNKAAGPDEIPNRVLQACATEAAPAITAIFQQSVNSGELPTDWRDANIAPVYKKGDRHAAENYRPVSLTCVISKLLEHIICHHMLDHLDKHKVLTSLNHGFRSGYSCETQLVVTAHDLLGYYDKNKQVDTIILDFSKAFDTVPHKLLLTKLENYGIRGKLLTWTSNFLTQRQMCVIVDGEKSRHVPVDSGVPQGTVLGPLLFLCHINDLPEQVKSHIRLFADDCLLYRAINTFKDHELLQEDLMKLQDWADTWGMKFNATKCYLLSTKQTSSYFYSIHTTILKRVQNNPYLGITFSEDLKWKTHISNITKRANSTLGFLRRNLRHCPESCRKNAYMALVRSKLEYGSVVWDPYLQGDIDRLERVQRSAARFITKDYRSRQPGCVGQMLKRLDLVPLHERRRHQRLTLLYKVVNGQVPAINLEDYLKPLRPKRTIRARQYENFIQTNIIENQVTNNSKCFQTIRAKTDNFKNSFFVRTALDWNKLRDSAVLSDSIETFKQKLLD